MTTLWISRKLRAGISCSPLEGVVRKLDDLRYHMSYLITSLHRDKMQRIAALDYIRGLMALSVMLYHYSSWTFGPSGSQTVIGRLGIYAVCTFYVLSGLSLAMVYRDKLNTPNDWIAFGIKRVFRIFPLFWLTVSLVITISLFKWAFFGEERISLNPVRLFLNYTLLFGFVRPNGYMSVGAWSIGNEMVFYALFPLIIIIGRKNFIGLVSILTGSLAIYCYYCFSLVPGSNPWWGPYIYPWNQLFLFVSGVAVGLLVKPSAKRNLLMYVGIIILIALFCWIPAHGDLLEIVKGFKRLFFTAVSLGICLLVYRVNPQIRRSMEQYSNF